MTFFPLMGFPRYQRKTKKSFDTQNQSKDHWLNLPILIF